MRRWERGRRGEDKEREKQGTGSRCQFPVKEEVGKAISVECVCVKE